MMASALLDVHVGGPQDLVHVLAEEGTDLDAEARVAVVLHLIDGGHVSQGRAAELLGISRAEMMELLAKHGRVTVALTPEEFAAEVARVV